MNEKKIIPEAHTTIRIIAVISAITFLIYFVTSHLIENSKLDEVTCNKRLNFCMTKNSTISKANDECQLKLEQKLSVLNKLYIDNSKLNNDIEHQKVQMYEMRSIACKSLFCTDGCMSIVSEDNRVDCLALRCDLVDE